MISIWNCNVIKATVPRANHEAYKIAAKLLTKKLIEYSKKIQCQAGLYQ